MAAEEATVVAEAEERTEEAINDKDKSSHQSIGGSSNDGGPDSTSVSVCRDDSNNDSGEAVGRWLENSSERWVRQ